MKIALPLIALLLLTACPNHQEQANSIQSDNIQPKQEKTTPLIEVTPQDNQEIHQKPMESKETIADEIFNNGFAIDDYPISVREISLDEFNKLNKNNNNWGVSYMPITELKNAIAELEDVVDFNEDGTIKQINFKNGGQINNPEGKFVAYYFDEKILVLEGGHLIDITYHLDTGRHTEKVGNPDHTSIPSPKKQYRLTGYFGGQECSHYFIQKHINGEWVKTIEFNPIIDKLLPRTDSQLYGFCDYTGSMFISENKAYGIKISKDDNEQELYTIHEITLKDEKAFKTLDLTTTPQKSLPLEVAIDFDNYEKLIQLNKQQAKFFAGLYPTAKEMVVLGKVSYQPDMTSLIMTFTNTENEHELETHLINIDKHGNIIDMLGIAYDEVAESWSKTTALLDKEQIKVTHFHDGEPIQENIYKIDDKGYFYLVDSKDFTNQENSDDN